MAIPASGGLTARLEAGLIGVENLRQAGFFKRMNAGDLKEFC
jgi:hypothetical protein